MRELLEKLEKSSSLNYAFGYVGNYNDVAQTARAYGLFTKNIKKKQAGSVYRKNRSILRIHGDLDKIDGFLSSYGSIFNVINRGVGPAPASIK